MFEYPSEDGQKGTNSDSIESGKRNLRIKVDAKKKKIMKIESLAKRILYNFLLRKGKMARASQRRLTQITQKSVGNFAELTDWLDIAFIQS